MKSRKQQNLILMCVTVILLTTVSPVIAYPPDNAAVLYYKAFMTVKEADEEVDKMLNDLRKGNIKPNDRIRRYIQQNKRAIELVETAADVRNCDWGNDISKGFDVLLPELTKTRKMAFLLTANAEVLAEDGEYKEALGKCLTIHKMGRHVGDRLLISYLVNIAMNALANGQITKILAQVPDDVDTLTWLKRQIYDISIRANTLKNTLSNEREIALKQIHEDKIDTVLGDLANIPDGLSKETIEKIRNGDEEFFAASREYYSNFISSVQVVLDLPYPESRNQLEQMHKDAEKQAKDNPASILSASLWPAVTKICTLEVRSKTNANALKAAIDIYIVKAKTGRLPETFPAGLPKDLYSGKDFKYEKTKDGFVLHCQGKDLDKNEFFKFEFEVPK